MVKKISISVADWIFNNYLIGQVNKSRFIEEMIIKGDKLEDNSIESYKNKLLDSNNELKEKSLIIANLKSKIWRLEDNIEKINKIKKQEENKRVVMEW